MSRLKNKLHQLLMNKNPDQKVGEFLFLFQNILLIYSGYNFEYFNVIFCFVTACFEQCNANR